MKFKFYLGDVIEHPTFGKGEVVDVIYRTNDVDDTDVPLIWVEFENLVVNSRGQETHKILFNENSLDEVLSR